MVFVLSVTSDLNAGVKICKKGYLNNNTDNCKSITSNVSNLTSLGYNDVVIAIDLNGLRDNQTAELCEHADFKGRCIVVKRKELQQMNLSEWLTNLSGLENKISSIRFNSHGAIFYNKKNVQTSGVSNIDDAYYLLQFDRKPSKGELAKVFVHPGWDVYLYKGKDFTSDWIICTSGTTTLPASWNNKVGSIKIQPELSAQARLFYGFKEDGLESDEPWKGYAGFVWIHSLDYPKIFMKELENNKSFKYKTADYYISLYGNVILEKTYNGKTEIFRSTGTYKIENGAYLFLNQAEFSMAIFRATDVPAGARKSIRNTSENLPSWFPNARHDYFVYAPATDDTAARKAYFEKLVVKNGTGNVPEKELFYKYADNYDLLWISAHGSFADKDNNNELNAYARNWPLNSKNAFASNETPSLKFGYKYNDGVANDTFNSSKYFFDKYIGSLNTDWYVSEACNQMGNSSKDISEVQRIKNTCSGLPCTGYHNEYIYYKDSYWSEIFSAWRETLKGVKGVGGIHGNSEWFDDYDDEYYERGRLWHALKAGKSMSQAWREALYSKHNVGGSYGNNAYRMPVFITKEKVDCTDETKQNQTYMFNDSPVLKNFPKKIRGAGGNEQEFGLFCKENSRFINSWKPKEKSLITIPSIVPVIIPEIYLPSELLSKFYIPANTTPEVIENFTSYYTPEATLTVENFRYTYELNRALKSLTGVFGDTDFIDMFGVEAENIALEQSDFDFEFTGAFLQEISSYLDNTNNGVELKNSIIQSITFVYNPKINGRILANGGIRVTFDGNGLKSIVNEIPKSLASQPVTIDVNDPVLKAYVIEQLPSEAEDFDTAKINYSIRPDGSIVPSYIVADPVTNEIHHIDLAE